MTGDTRPAGGMMLLLGIIIATFTEAIAGTVLSLGRSDIIGDTYATPDEFAWLDIGYTTLKLLSFFLAPWLLTRLGPYRLAITATLVMGIACGLAIVSARLDLLILVRGVQGLSGGLLLVAGQVIVFLAYPGARQPILQALFAFGSVVSPATVAPALHGWLIDSYSWTWIFFIVVPVAFTSIGILLMADAPSIPRNPRRTFDGIGFSLISVALFCGVYVFIQGHRWDWFEEPLVLWLTMIGAAAFLAFLGRQVLLGGRGLLDLTPFRSENFLFAFLVSFVAGAALFGSAFLIPSFAVQVLAFTPADAGMLLLPGGAFFVGALLVAAFLFQMWRVPPIATVPFGILLIMASMWMLSGSTSESGESDMMAATLLRGAGLGLLFLSLTLTAFGDLPRRNLAAGIGIFNTGRQLGGLIGVAWLQTLIDHHIAGNVTILGTHITSGTDAVGARVTGMAAMLVGKGMDAQAADHAATALLDKALILQSTVIAFDTAFNAVALLFVFAAPLLVTIKITLHHRHKSA
jgi:MFS transporter, DHA2 family, multidrug resistance protein